MFPYKTGSVKLTSPFGMRKDPLTGAMEFHGGVDIVGLTDKRVVAVRNGRVAFAGRVNDGDSGGRTWQWGNYVRIDTADGKFKDYYCHLSEVTVKAGDAVRAGDTIGTEGKTGRATGSHLHFETRRFGTEKLQLDPSALLGIRNKNGIYNIPDKGQQATLYYKKAVVDRCGFEDITARYMDAYKYSAELWCKLYCAMFSV